MCICLQIRLFGRQSRDLHFFDYVILDVICATSCSLVCISRNGLECSCGFIAMCGSTEISQIRSVSTLTISVMCIISFLTYACM